MKAINMAGLAALAATASVFAGVPSYQTTASMNYYDLSAKPIPGNTAIIGERDINYLTLTGEPFGFYQLHGVDNIGRTPRGNGPSNHNIRRWDGGVFLLPFEPLVGQLDVNGQAKVQMPYRLVQAQQSFTLVATVDNGTPTPSQLTTDVMTFRSKSGFIEMGMAAGSLAHSRGCLMGLDIPGQRLWIGNIEYAFNAKTDLANFTSMDQLVVGKTWLNVNGRYDNAGGFIANEVGLEDMEPYTRLEGRVQGKGESGLIIMNVSAFISPETLIFDHDTGATMTFADVDLFMPVEIWIDTNDTMYPHIVKMSINTPIEAEPEPEPETENESEDPPPSYCG